MRLAMLAMIVTIFAGCEFRDDPYINAHQPEIKLGMNERTADLRSYCLQ